MSKEKTFVGAEHIKQRGKYTIENWKRVEGLEKGDF